MDDRGFSIISILIGIALVSIAFTALQTSKWNLKKTKKYLLGNDEFVTVEDTLKVRVAEIVNRALFEDCETNAEEIFLDEKLMKLGGSTVSLYPILGTGGGQGRNSENTIQVKGDQIPRRYAEAMQRCENPYITPNQEKHYFCLRFPKEVLNVQGQGQGQGQGQSIFFREASSPIISDEKGGGFAEYAVQFLSLRTNLPISCSEWKANYKASGLLFFYTLYWQAGTERSPSFHYLNGTFFKGSR